jgi:ubiquinone/menaquinone biosynthesis C-methylase UbiE
MLGADLSMGMLSEARGRVHGPLVQMDMHNLAVRSASVSGVWCAAALLHIPKNEASDVLREIRRVLAKGGPLFMSLQVGDGERWEESSYGPVDRFFARYTADEAEGLLLRSGFDVIGTRCERARTAREWIHLLACRSGD